MWPRLSATHLATRQCPTPHPHVSCLPVSRPVPLLALGGPSQAWQLTAPPDVVFPPLLQLAPGLAGAVQSVGRPSAADLAATSAQPVGTTGGVPESLVPTTGDTSAAAGQTKPRMLPPLPGPQQPCQNLL